MKILLGSCTEHDREGFEKTPLYESLLIDSVCTTLNVNTLIYDVGDLCAIVRINNKKNIGIHYNRVLEMSKTGDFKCVILIHDDVSVEDSLLCSKLEEAFRVNDIVGLAGATQVEVVVPALWHIMSKREHWSGNVAHPHQLGGVSVTAFGPAPRRCLVLDGLFLAIKTDCITPEILFDEDIPAVAMHYDLDFCLNANKHELKLTTWPIWVVHSSPGLKDMNKEYKDSEKYFLDKWRIN